MMSKESNSYFFSQFMDSQKGFFFCCYVFPSSWGSGIISECYIQKEDFVFIQLLIYSFTVYTYTLEIFTEYQQGLVLSLGIKKMHKT